MNWQNRITWLYEFDMDFPARLRVSIFSPLTSPAFLGLRSVNQNLPKLAGMITQNPDSATGATIFSTLRLADRNEVMLVRHIDVLRRAIREVKQRHPFHIDAIAVLPAVIHMIWTLPAGDHNHTRRIALLKSRFSREMPFPAFRTLAQIKRGEKAIWQRRNWEHRIQDASDFARHRDLIYLSPVEAGLCAKPGDWLHSSFHRDMKTDDVVEPMPKWETDRQMTSNKAITFEHANAQAHA